MEIKTDLGALRKVLELPPGAFPCRWTARPAGGGSSRAPGPTDYVLYAYVELDEGAWKALGKGEEDGPGNANTAVLPLPVAEAILPEGVRKSGVAGTAGLRVRGEAVPLGKLGRMPYRPRQAARVGNALVVVLATA